MDYFKITKMPKLSYDEVIKSILPEHHLVLKDAKTGKQPLNTVIIGVIKKEARVQKMINFKGSQRKRFYLTEVTANKKEGEKFQIILVGNYAVELEKAIDNINCHIWLIIKNSDICNYNGCEKDVSNLSLRVEESKINKQPEIIMICESPSQSPKISDKLMDYVPLNDVIQNKRYNLFALVEEVIKPTTVLRNGNKHTMLALVDPSCRNPDAVRKDLPTNIFFNNPKENFKELIMEGDILRIRDMLIELYVKDDKIYGKIYSSNSITHFKNSEPNNNVSPITTYCNYVLTEQDRSKVIELREWWQQIKNNCNGDDSFLDEKTISDVTEPSMFHLFCQVTEIRPISTYDKMVILRVTDGTTSKAVVNKFSMHEATQDLLSPNSRAVTNAKEIDVAIFDLEDITASIKVNDFLKLENVSAEDLNDYQNSDILGPILEFNMKKIEQGRITILPDTHTRARQIIRRLKCQTEPEETTSDDDSIIQIARTLQNLDNNLDFKRRLKCQTEPEETTSDDDSIIQIARTLQNLDNNLDFKRKNVFGTKECTASSPLKKKLCLVDLSQAQSSVADDLHSVNVKVTSFSNNNNCLSSPLSAPKDLTKLRPSKVCHISNIISLPSMSMSNAINIVDVDNGELKKNGPKSGVDINDGQSDLPLQSVTISNSLAVLNDSSLVEDLPVSISPVKEIEISQLKKTDSILKESIIEEQFVVTNHFTDRPVISCPVKNNTIDSCDRFNVTSTPVRSQLNKTPLYDGLNMDLNMSDGASPQSPIIGISLPKRIETFPVKLTNVSDISSKSLYEFGKFSLLDQIIELSDPTPDPISLGQMIKSCKMGDTWQSYVILKEILTQSRKSCSECAKYDIVLCFHDMIWGICTKGEHRIQPSELREKYSKEDILNNKGLYCKDCPLTDDNQGNNLEFSIEPFFKLLLKVQDVSTGQMVSVHLEGDHAETFFGVKPSFKWSVAPCDIGLLFKFFCLEQARQMPLKFGFCCYENNGQKFIQVSGTKMSSCKKS